MRIPPLHLRWQLFLRPFLRHRLVFSALIVGQLLLNLLAGLIVVLEVVQRSWRVSRQLCGQLVYFLPVHGSHDLMIRPFSGFKRGSLRSLFNFAVQVFANKLEMRENSPI